MNHLDALKPSYSFSHRLRPASAKWNSNPSQVLLCGQQPRAAAVHTGDRKRGEAGDQGRGVQPQGLLSACRTQRHSVCKAAEREGDKKLRALPGPMLSICKPRTGSHLPATIHSVTPIYQSMLSGQDLSLPLTLVTGVNNFSSNHISL